jgi:serine/threonine-protein kinase
MASVYEAVDEKLGRRVAVKELHEHLMEHAVLATRFSREALAVASVNHPGIVSIYDSVAADREQGVRPALVMEFVDGRTLRSFLDEQGALDPIDVITLGRALCDALGSVHAAGLVHRDLTPSNVLLCRTGEVKLADFGIATSGGATDLTATGTFVGTARYLSPEQLADGAVDGRSDLYSLGLVLYEAVTGVRPFEGSHDAAVALARLDRDPTAPHLVIDGIPPRLSDAIMWALQRDRADRPGRAVALAEALTAASRSSPAAAGSPGSLGVARDVTDEMPRPTAPRAAPPTPTVAPSPTPLTTEPPDSGDAAVSSRRQVRGSTVVAVSIVVAAVTTVLALVGIIG